GRGPKDLEELSVVFAARLLRLTRPELDEQHAEREIRRALTSGKGLEKLAQIIEFQGGNPAIIDHYSKLPLAEKQSLVCAEQNGFVAEIHAEQVGRAAMLLGAGRHLAHEHIDHGVGILLKVRVGDSVHTGEPLAELHYRDEPRLGAATQLVR